MSRLTQSARKSVTASPRSTASSALARPSLPTPAAMESWYEHYRGLGIPAEIDPPGVSIHTSSDLAGLEVREPLGHLLFEQLRGLYLAGPILRRNTGDGQRWVFLAVPPGWPRGCAYLELLRAGGTPLDHGTRIPLPVGPDATDGWVNEPELGRELPSLFTVTAQVRKLYQAKLAAGR